MGEIALRPGLLLRQEEGFFPLGQDTVLLAYFAAPRAAGRGLDLGAGQGFLGILTALRNPKLKLEGLELQPEAATVAEQNAARAGIPFPVAVGDLRALPKALYGRYDFILCNPPYFGEKRGKTAKNPALAQARCDLGAEIGQVCAAAFSALKTGGKLFLCFPPMRLAPLLAAMAEHRLEPKRLRTVQLRPDTPPVLLLTEAVKQGGEGLEWLPPLLLRDENGTESREYRAIYEG